MMNIFYVKLGTLFNITQSIPDSITGDTVTIKIKRLSDGYTWHFTNLAFESGSNSGSMTFFDDITWKQSFTPPTKDQYIVTITHVALDVKYTQTIIAEDQGSNITVVEEISETTPSALLTAVNQAIAARLNGGAVQAYTIGGRNIQYMALADLFKLRESLQREVNTTTKGPAQTLARFQKAS